MEGEQKAEQKFVSLASPAFQTPAVSVKNGYKAYSKGKNILENFNMTVSRGTIYGLLGSSGCGKTTMLSCITGLHEMDSGEIKVFGQKPGSRESGIPGRRLGYMPQDIALYPHLTIKELLQYFGKIYGLSDLKILSRIELLTNFLDLPSGSRRINTLSGGQQRRTSLATALVGEPELLILDEPTVGVDPLLRENIWEHLVQITNMGKTTVIVTTHYIEEARQAHTIGLMRHGRLLVEDSPDVLLKQHKATLLEEIVLRLCRKDQSNIPTTGNKNSEKLASSEISFYSKRKLHPALPKVKKKEDGLQTSENIVGLKYQRRYSIMPGEVKISKPRRQSMMGILQDVTKARTSRITALIKRNFLIFTRNPVFCLGFLALPTFCSVISSASVGYDVRNMNFGVVNYELPNWKEVCHTDNNNNISESLQNLSCRFLNALPDDVFNLLPYDTTESALHGVHEGKVWGVLTFPDGYSENFVQRAASKNYATNETMEGSNIAIRLDESNYLASLLMTRNFYYSFETYVAKLASDFGQNPREFELPLEYREPVYGTHIATDNEYITSPMLILIIFITSMASCSLNYIYDKNMGTLERSRSAGVQTADLLAAYFITEGLAVLAETLMSIACLTGLFSFNVRGSYVLYTLLCLLVGIVGQTWGFIIGIVVADETAAFMVELCIFIPLMILTGVTWPLEAVPHYIKYFCYCLPGTLASGSLRSITIRGLGFTHPLVWPGFAAVTAWILVSWAVAVVLYRILK